MRSKVSKFPLVLLGIAISGPPRPRFRSAEESFTSWLDPSALFEVIIWGFIFLYVIHIILNYSLKNNRRTFVPTLYLKGAAKLYFGFAILSIVSVFYSVRPEYTIYFALQFFSMFVLAAFVAQRFSYDPWVLVKVLFVTFAIMFVTKFVNYIYDPSMVGVFLKNGNYRLIGGWLGGYGAHEAYTAVACLILLVIKPLKGSKKLLLVIVFICALYFVYLAKTRHAYIFLIATLFPLFLLNKKLKYTKFTFIYLIMLVIVAVYSLGIFDKFALIFIRDYKSIHTLSGRTVLLSTILNHWNEYMPFGDGFEAGSRYWLIRLGFAQRGLGAAHDSISRVSVELGIPGIILLFLTIIVAWKQYWKIFNYSMVNWKYDPQKASLFLLVVFLGGNIFYQSITLISSQLVASGSSLTIIYLLTIQMLTSEIKSEKKNKYAEKQPENINYNAVV